MTAKDQRKRSWEKRESTKLPTKMQSTVLPTEKQSTEMSTK